MRKTVTDVILTDDLDGTTAVDTFQFGYNGDSYEIELSPKNAAAFEKILTPYLDAARRVGRTTGNGRRAAAGKNGKPNAGVDKYVRAQVREWANDNGYQVAAQGRIAVHIVEAYRAANK